MTPERKKYLANISDREKFIRRRINYTKALLKQEKAVFKLGYGMELTETYKHIRLLKNYLWCYKQALIIVIMSKMDNLHAG